MGNFSITFNIRRIEEYVENRIDELIMLMKNPSIQVPLVKINRQLLCAYYDLDTVVFTLTDDVGKISQFECFIQQFIPEFQVGPFLLKNKHKTHADVNQAITHIVQHSINTLLVSLYNTQIAKNKQLIFRVLQQTPGEWNLIMLTPISQIC